MRVQEKQDRKKLEGGETPQRDDTRIRGEEIRKRENKRQKCPETLVKTYHNALRNNREQHTSHDAGHPKIHHRRSTHFRLLVAWTS
jgi:phage terminase small subunit